MVNGYGFVRMSTGPGVSKMGGKCWNLCVIGGWNGVAQLKTCETWLKKYMGSETKPFLLAT